MHDPTGDVSSRVNGHGTRRPAGVDFVLSLHLPKRKELDLCHRVGSGLVVPKGG